MARTQSIFSLLAIAAASIAAFTAQACRHEAAAGDTVPSDGGVAADAAAVGADGSGVCVLAEGKCVGDARCCPLSGFRCGQDCRAATPTVLFCPPPEGEFPTQQSTGRRC